MNKRSLYINTITLAVLALVPLPALADYHYASHTGTNTPPYESWATAADSIQKAIDASSPHDTVYISAGNWYETVATGEYDSVAIIGAGMDSTYWYSDTYHVPVLTIDYNCSLEGVTLRHLPGWKALEARTYAGVRISSCRFISTGFAFMGSGGTTIVENCIFDSCQCAISIPISADTIFIMNNIILNTLTLGHPIEVFNTSFAKIINNIIMNYPQNRVNLNGIPLGNGIGEIKNNIVANTVYGISATMPEITSNSVNGCVDYGIVFGVTPHNLTNNAISCDMWGILAEAPVSANYNNFWNCDVAIYGTISDSIGNIFVNPMYVSDRDFHLQMYSPLIDAGDPAILDLDSTRSDIGAYGGPHGSSYIYQDLAPGIPDTIRGRYNQDTAFISWTANSEADFDHYLLYRDTVGGFIPSTANLIAQPETAAYIDLDVNSLHDYYYRVAAVDNQDNISGYSAELVVITTAIWDQPGAELPQLTVISSNYPNPFNLSTMVVYRVANLGPQPAEIEIDIYDVVGRKVKTLVNERKEAGEHRVIWDGKDDNGDKLASGVYFARISQWGLELSGKPRKLVLIK